MKDRLSQWIQAALHKKMVIGAIVVLAIGASYFGYQQLKSTNVAVTYTIAAVSKGTLITSVSGTGQVSVSQQVDIKPKVSGQITSVNVKNGQTVKANDLLAHVDSKDAEKAVRDASINLQSTQVALDKLKKPADEFAVAQAKSDLEQSKTNLTKLQNPPTDYDLTTAENAVTQAQRDLQLAKDNNDKIKADSDRSLQKAYDDSYTVISNAYIDIPDLIKDALSVHFTKSTRLNETDSDNTNAYKLLLGENSTLIARLVSDYNDAFQLFNTNFDEYKTFSTTADQSTRNKLLNDTLVLSKSVSKALESARNMLDEIVSNSYNYKVSSIAPTIDLLRPLMLTDIGIINKDITALQNIKDTVDTTNQNTPLDLKNAETAITSAEEKLKEKQSFLDKLKAGATPEDLANAQENVKKSQDALDKLLAGADALDIRAQELAVKAKSNALFDAKQTLSDYSIVAPFDGIISKVNVNKGDTVSSGTVAATVITQQLLATISLNEVDAAKIKVGEKATMTFDAIDSLTLTGVVSEIDTVGTVSQGVVTYNVKIAFDTQDDRVKAGMSISASIITNAIQDAILAPNGAVKSQGNQYYVEMIDNPTPTSSTTTNSDTSTIITTTLPRQQPVEIGIANDTMTVITSGLNEGDQIVVKTSNPNKTTTTTPAAGVGGLRIPGLGGGGGRGG